MINVTFIVTFAETEIIFLNVYHNNININIRKEFKGHKGNAIYSMFIQCIYFWW